MYVVIVKHIIWQLRYFKKMAKQFLVVIFDENKLLLNKKEFLKEFEKLKISFKCIFSQAIQRKGQLFWRTNSRSQQTTDI